MNMVKKLVCGVISAAVALGAASAWAAGTSSYVQDGLIACWDGIENAGAGVHDGSATVWKDVKGGYEFSLTGVTVDDDRMTFAGTASSYGALSAAGTAATFGAAMNGTLEIVYVTRDNSVGQILLQTPRDSVGMAFGDILSGTTHILVPYGGAVNQPAFAFSSGATTNSVSVRYTSGAPVSASANGAALSQLNTGNLSGEGTETIIGTRINKQSSHFPGSIYCIRLYSRQLTNAEIAANLAVDQKRFILHIGPDTLHVTALTEGIGSPSPAYGFVNGLAPGETRVVSCGSPVVTNAAGTFVFSCTGWKLYDANGNVVSNGTETSFTYTHPTPAAARELEWQWTKARSASTIYDGMLPVGGAAFHVDASVPATLTTIEAADGRQLVTAWRDASDGAIVANAWAGSRPWIVTTNGLPYIDFGQQRSGSAPTSSDLSGCLGWSTQLTNIREVFLVFSDYPGSSHSFFLGDSGTYHFHRNQKKLFNSQFASTYVQNGLKEVDGVVRTIDYALSEGFHLIHLRTTGNVTASRFAQDRSVNFGGQRLREVIVYTDTLTDAEAGNTYDYLYEKWFNNPGVLEVDAAPEQLGSPSPLYGTLFGLTAGETRVVSCGSPVVTNSAEDIEYTCAGWRLYDTDGNVVSNGTETSFTYTHPTPVEYRRLEWLWEVSSVKGTVSAGAGGSVSPSGTAWFAVNTPVTLTATPNAGNGFIKWSGDLPTGVSDMSASFTFTPTAPFELTASFGSAYYVATTGSDDNDGSEEHPFATVSNAVEKAAAAIDLNGGRAVIRLAAGTYNESGLVLDRPISVVGASREGVIINDGIVGKRAFTLSHDEALVSSLTITNFGYKTNGGEGGHIRMTAGRVVDCVIKDGRAAAYAGYGNGGNVWMSGGRLERCYVVNGRANWGAWCGSKASYGMGLYASGGVVDSCFFKNNRDDNNNGRNYGSVYLDGAVTMVNCMVTGGYSRYGEACGIVINNASAKVVNSIAYGNYNTTSSTADSNFGNKNLGRYFHCASVVTNASCATWTVLKDEDFVNYHTYSIPTQRSPVFDDLQAYLTSEEYENFDWRLRLTSPAIDAGTTDTDYRPAGCATLDLDGNARVSGSSIDLGCWEYDQSHLTCGAYLDGYGTLENGTLSFHATSAGASGAVFYRWDYGNGVTVETPNADHTYSYPAAGYYTARVQASSDGGSTWSDWFTVPTRVAVAPEVMYVDSNCATPTFPYKTRATAANTLGAAVGVLTNNVSVNQTIIGGVEIVVLSGSRSNDTGMFLATAVTIRGESSDPADAEIVDSVVGSRAFTITHPDVVVSNLTISGSGLRTNGGQGGHLKMTAGLVSNCAIKNGRAGASKGYGNGGNVWMSGGRFERCLVTGGTANWGGFSQSDSYGMGLYATGGVIDSCFFKDNKTDNSDGNNAAVVYLDGAATLVNCTVTGGLTRNYKGKGSGIYIGNANAKVVNCIACGNYIVTKPNIYHTAAANFGSANYGRYFYCAAAFTNTSCATWTVLKDDDLVKFRTFSGTKDTELSAYFGSEEYAGFDWHQRLSSLLVEGGTTDPDYRPADGATLDLDGNPRVAGTSIDIGCWEYAQSQFTCGGSLSKYGALESETVTFNGFAAGPSIDVVFRWDYGNGVTEETQEAHHSYSYPAAGYFTVKVQASPDGGNTWTDWYTVPTRIAVAPAQMFVDSNCATPAFPYKTRATAANTLGAAVGALTNNVSENQTVVDDVDIVVLKGSRSNDTGFFLATAVRIRGESVNPADAEIVDDVVGSRAFTITHPDVVVSNLTISGLGLRMTAPPCNGEGGHIRMTGGLVANCVIKNGRASGQKSYGNGGNVWMSGGRVERCLVSGGTANWGTFPNHESCGMGLYATGGVIDSCFFKDNKTDSSDGQNSASVYLNGPVTMVNCTVTGGWARNYNVKGSGIHIASASAKAVNCVAYGNYIGKGTITSTAVANFGNANYDRYFYCGAAFTNASCATWTMLTDADFVKYSSFTGSTEAQLKTYFGSEEYSTFDWHQKRHSQLIDRGTTDTAYRPADSSAVDLDGNLRVDDKTIDLGCWEVYSNQGFFIRLR